MAKIERTVQVAVCDFCEDQSESCYHACLNCERDMCFNCQQHRNKAVEYRYMWAVGNTVVYCRDCDGVLTKQGTDQLHKLLVRLRTLKEDSERFYKENKLQQEATAQQIGMVMQDRGLK